jgi:hypothetical protein
MGPLAWLKVLAENRRTIFGVIRDGFGGWWAANTRNRVPSSATGSVGEIR